MIIFNKKSLLKQSLLSLKMYCKIEDVFEQIINMKLIKIELNKQLPLWISNENFECLMKDMINAFANLPYILQTLLLLQHLIIIKTLKLICLL